MSGGCVAAGRAECSSVDVLIVGGGIAGLWMLSRLVAKGYHAVLLERSALGAGQSIASQGIIHGGIKYTLGLGAPGEASKAIARMPEIWKECLEGRGEVDLRAARVLTPEQYLWTTPGLASKIAGFGASKTIRTRVDRLRPEQRPELLRGGGRRGMLGGIEVYRVEEPVLDVRSVLHALASPLADRIVRVGEGLTARYEMSRPEGMGEIRSVLAVELIGSGRVHRWEAKRVVFASGVGNEELCRVVGAGSGAQRRPLHMVMVRGVPGPLYGHCLGASTVPRLTVSAAQDSQGRWVWYVGGQIAETGVSRSEAEQVAAAKEELRACLGWLDLGHAEFSTLRIDRAERAVAGGARPDGPEVVEWLNMMVAWPTKLAFAPELAAKVLGAIEHAGISPDVEAARAWRRPEWLEHPPVAEYPWDEPGRLWVDGGRA